MTETVAFVGATGGAGTTTTVVEFAAALARDGRTVRILDTAYATQGLARYVEGRIDTDVTALCADDGDDSERGASLTEATFDLEFDADVPGRVAVTPADAPFERLARAKTTTAARRFQTLCRDARRDADSVLLDVPPVAANQHVAAVTEADRAFAVTPGDDRGADALRQLRDRLADIDAELDGVVSTGGDITPADAVLPNVSRSVTDDPTALGDDEAAATVVATTETALDTDLGIEIDTDGVVDQIRERLDRSDEPAGSEDDPNDTTATAGTTADGHDSVESGGSLLETEPPDGDGKRSSANSADDDEDAVYEAPDDTEPLADDTE